MRILAKIFLAIATLTIEVQYTIFKIFHCEIPNFLSKDVTLKKKKKKKCQILRFPTGIKAYRRKMKVFRIF